MDIPSLVSLVKASIGWTLLLITGAVAAVFAVNIQFQAINTQFLAVNAQFRTIEHNLDQKIQALSDSVDRRFEAVDNRLDRIEVDVATILTTLRAMQSNQTAAN